MKKLSESICITDINGRTYYHQWFEIKKLNNIVKLKDGYYDSRSGVLVKCADCNEQKELWEDE